MIGWFKKNKKEEDMTASDRPEDKKDATEMSVSDPVLTAEIKTNTDVATFMPNTEENVAEIVKEEKQIPSEPTQPPPLTYREMKSLKKNRYEEIMDNPKCTKSYVLKNKKTGQIVEIKAFSSFHACNIIGWKPNKVSVIEEKDLTPPKPAETSTLSK